MTNYVIDTSVVKLERKSRASTMNVIGKDENGKNIYEIEREDMGWFVLLKNSHEWLFLGFQEPELVIGQSIKIRLEPQ